MVEKRVRGVQHSLGTAVWFTPDPEYLQCFPMNNFLQENEHMKVPKTNVNVTPLSNRVLIKRDEPKTMTEGGIALPDTALGKPTHGTILSVGPGKYSDKGDLIPMQVKAGDRVLITNWAGNEVDLEGEKLLFCTPEDILGILN